MFSGIGALPEPATGSHVVNRGTPLAPCRLKAQRRGFSEAVTRKFFLGPDSGNSNILLLLFSCTNKRTCGDMQDR